MCKDDFLRNMPLVNKDGRSSSSLPFHQWLQRHEWRQSENKKKIISPQDDCGKLATNRRSCFVCATAQHTVQKQVTLSENSDCLSQTKVSCLIGLSWCKRSSLRKNACLSCSHFSIGTAIIGDMFVSTDQLSPTTFVHYKKSFSPSRSLLVWEMR